MKKWRFPNNTECKQCHQVERSYTQSDSGYGRSILGFFTAQLNRPYLEKPSLNQFQFLFDKGLLSGSALRDWNVSWVPRWPALSQATVNIDRRDRAYLATNCSGCHDLRGIKSGTSVQGHLLNFDFHTMI
jgi:hypothetical protein